jgi:uncharacterized protein YndB with AHSA1/START domain
MTIITRSHEVFVRTSLQKAFAYVSDLTRHPEWSGGELKIEEVAAGPIGVGKSYRSRGEVAVQKERPNTVEVTAYEPPTRFAFEAQDPDFGTVTHEFTFAGGNGGVLIRRVMTVDLNSIIGLGFRLFVYPLIGRPSMNKAMASLKAKLEEQA